MSKKNILISFLLVVALYLYMHNPILVPLGGMGAVKLLYLVFIAVFLSINNSYKEVSSTFGKEVRCYTFLVIYISLRTIIYSGEFITAYTSLVLFIEDVLVPFAVVCLLTRADIDFERFKRMLLIVGSIGAVISTVCLFVPSFNSFVRTSVITIEENSYLDLNVFRGFGIAGELTYSYGIVQGFIFSIALFNIKNNKWVIPFLPLIFLSIATNARTGMLVAFLGLILFLFQGKKSSVLIVAVFTILVISYVLPALVANVDVVWLGWVEDFFRQITAVFEDHSVENSSTANTLFGVMWVLPDTVGEWIFGRGYSIFTGASIGHSDVGWILQLNLGGLIYVIGWFTLFMSLFKKLKFSGMDKWQILLLLGTLVIANTKGDAFSNSGTIRCLLIYMYYYVYEKYKNPNNIYLTE